MKMTIVGATGAVGGRVLEQVVQAGAVVTVVARHPEKLPAALRAKVQVEPGSLEDETVVARATQGAEALLWLTPANPRAAELRGFTLGLAENAVRAIRANGVSRVVFIGSHGADRRGLGLASVAGEVEAMLAAAAPNTVSLRSAGLMENLLTSVESLRRGLLVGVLPPNKKYFLVAGRDVGDVAARWLLNPSWTGHQVHGVHGPRDVSPNEQAEQVARVLGFPLHYRQVPVEAFRDSLLKRGATPSVAAAFVEMFTGFAEPGYQPSEPRTALTTTPTTLETFVREQLAPRLHSAPVA